MSTASTGISGVSFQPISMKPMPVSILIVEDEFLIAVEMEEVIKDLGHQSATIPTCSS